MFFGIEIWIRLRRVCGLQTKITHHPVFINPNNFSKMAFVKETYRFVWSKTGGFDIENGCHSSNKGKTTKRKLSTLDKVWLYFCFWKAPIDNASVNFFILSLCVLFRLTKNFPLSQTYHSCSYGPFSVINSHFTWRLDNRRLTDP